MKTIKIRISVLLVAVLLIGLYPLANQPVYGENELKSSFEKSLNGTSLNEKISVVPNISNQVKSSFFNKNQRLMANRSEFADENQATPVINFEQVVQDRITTPGSLQVYLLENSSPGKITVYMNVPEDSGINYDLYLYRYNEQTGGFDFVDGSVNPSGSFEQIAAICDQGVYVVGVELKNLTTQVQDYAFKAVYSETYSSNEPNDKISQSKEYKIGTVLKDSIDNEFDKDYYITQVTTGSTYEVILDKIPDNAKYHVVVYDSDLNFVGGNYITKDNKNFSIGNLSQGVYLIQIGTSQGYSASNEYEFQLLQKNEPNSIVRITRSGQIIELTEQALYINGQKADMNWSSYYNINYTRNQEVRVAPQTVLHPAVYENGTYRGPQGISSDDCVRVGMKNFSYMYFYKQLISNGQYVFEYVKPEEMTQYAYFYVDAKTGKAIDTEWNWYYWGNNMPQIFTPFN